MLHLLDLRSIDVERNRGHGEYFGGQKSGGKVFRRGRKNIARLRAQAKSLRTDFADDAYMIKLNLKGGEKALEESLLRSKVTDMEQRDLCDYYEISACILERAAREHRDFAC